MTTEVATAPTTPSRSESRIVGQSQITLGVVLTYGVLLLGALIIVFPFIWMIFGSFKNIVESNAYPPTLLPEQWYPQNYVEAWLKPPNTLGRYIANSVLIATVGTGIQVAICALAAYAFSRLRFPGRDLLFMIVLATTMIPGEITLIPNFVTIRRFPLLGGNDLFGAGGSGLYDTYAAMILPGLVGAFNIFLLRQAFLTIPNEFWEAAQLDGCGSFGYLRRIVLPLSVPALLTVAIFGFIGRWNGLLWPLLITRSESIRPVQMAMIYYQNEFLTDFGMVMAASLMVTLPIVVLFLLLQRQFIEGIMSTGLKG
ncbi:MAG TPA: carbohydrate ABC transporter permease [Caldilineaceae bacterium]|nr:carbohydrate ABC transporter permease [Caldilineaceae bacterium]